MGGAGVVEQPFSGFAQLGSRWTAGTQGAEQPAAADLTRNQIRRSPNRARAPGWCSSPFLRLAFAFVAAWHGRWSDHVLNQGKTPNDTGQEVHP